MNMAVLQRYVSKGQSGNQGSGGRPRKIRTFLLQGTSPLVSGMEQNASNNLRGHLLQQYPVFSGPFCEGVGLLNKVAANVSWDACVLNRHSHERIL
jgi:hypothetical protein